MKIVKGYLKFNLKKDGRVYGYQKGEIKSKKYKVEQQQKQCDIAFSELKKQELKGLITNLVYTKNPDGSVVMTWERVT